MAPRKNARSPTPSSVAASQLFSSSSSSSAKAHGGAANWDQVLANIYQYYMKQTPQRTKLVDAFLVFLVANGALQFLYCVLAGNYVRGRVARRRPLHRVLTSLARAALQRFSFRLLGHCRPIRLDGYGLPGGRVHAPAKKLVAVALRIQTSDANKSSFTAVSPERSAKTQASCPRRDLSC